VILPYSIRLLCLCLASFFLVHLALGLVVTLLTPPAIRMAEQINPRSAARFLLALRLFPSTFAIFLVIGLCVPSYLWLEPEAAGEHMRWELLTAALFGLTIWACSMARGLRAMVRSRRHDQYCGGVGRRTRIAGEPTAVWVIPAPAPFFALTGIVHPRLVISRAILEALSAEQLAAALLHERAHRISRDNLKRLFILCAPDILPFFRGPGALERGWARFTEWAADDAAAEGNSDRSLSLAAALVRVARMGSVMQPPSLATALLANGQDLQARVDRLLSVRPLSDKRHRVRSVVVASVTGVLALSLMTAMLQPATLHAFHVLIEHLIQ
jgi:hypothetical protein